MRGQAQAWEILQFGEDLFSESHGKLWFVFQDEREKSRKQMLCTERFADSPGCPWDQKMSLLQTQLAFGACHWNFGGADSAAHVLVLEVVLAGKETVTGWRVGYVMQFDFANVVRRTWGIWGKRPELLRALNSRWGEGWGSAREWFSPWTSWNKKESQAWSVGTNSSYPRLCQDSGWKFWYRSWDEARTGHWSLTVLW